MRSFGTKKAVGLFFSLFVILAMAFVLMKTVNADSWAWTSGVPVTVSADDTATDGSWRDICQAKFNAVKMSVAVQGTESLTTPTSDCLIAETQSYKLFSYTVDGARSLAIQFNGDLNAHQIRGASCESCVYMPSRDMLINIESTNVLRSGRVAMYKNFVSKLQLKNTLSLDQKYYEFDQTEPDQMISDFYPSAKYTAYTKTLQRSTNDKWLVLEFPDEGLFRLDIDSMQMVKFSDWKTEYNIGFSPSIEYDITDDGQHVAVFGRNTISAIFDLTAGCGNTMPSTASSEDIDRVQQTACPLHSVGGDQTYMPNLRDTFQPQFSDDGGEISFYATSMTNNPRHITLRAAGYPGQPALDYLALGDSFSSGQGDIGKKADGTSYFLDGTGYNGGCNLSERSYPFLLQAKFRFLASSVKSVACGGAVTRDIKLNDDTYLGQADRFKNLSDPVRDSLQAGALDTFTPGYVEQVKFVRRYKPSSITLTVGGNDVGFPKKIIKCANSTDSCEYVVDESRKASLGYEIKNEFYILSALYKELHEASPKTKIYVIGYPSFISPAIGRFCGFDNGFLDDDEKIMIDESVKYMNQTIHEAASSAGVKYIDIYNSLVEGRICDNSNGHYVTGLRDVDALNESTYYNTFHPNAAGHAKMSDAISGQLDGQNLVNYSYDQVPDSSATAPVPTTYFSSAMNTYDQTGTRYQQVTNGTVTKGEPTEVVTAPLTYEGGMDVHTGTYTTYTDLGVIKADADGSIHAQITIPASVPAGYHTLVMSGKSRSGDPIELEQVILVQGSNPNDRDEDGISDDHDSCMFIEPSGVDANNNGIDDICEPKTSKPTAPANLQANSTTNTSPTFNWTAVSGVTSYNVYRDGVLIGATGTTSYIYTTAPEGLSNYFVTAVNNGVESDHSKSVSVVVDRTPPAVKNITLSGVSTIYVRSLSLALIHLRNSQVTISADATDAGAGVAGGEYYVGTDPGKGHGILMTYTNGKLSANIPTNSLPRGMHYLYVRASDMASNWSSPISIMLIYL